MLVFGVLRLPAPAVAPVHVLGEWQASRVARSHAALMRRPGFRVERLERLSSVRVRVCWSEPGYLSPIDGRDRGCDIVELRGGQWWLFDDSVLGAGWVRWL
jgi:hypothetical protein